MKEERESVKEQPQKSDDRYKEATSSETLSDVESAENMEGKPSGSATSTENASSIAAPDGLPGDARTGRADGSDSGGPM